MRIGMFSESYDPVQNGVSTSVQTLVDELRDRRHHVVIVAPHYPNHVDGPCVLRVPSVLTPFNPDYAIPYPWFPQLRRKFRKIRPDVLHTHNPFFLGLLARRLAKRDKVPLVSTYHTLYNHYAHYVSSFLPSSAVKGLLEWWIPGYYNRCQHVIVPSKVAEESLRQYGVETNISVIPTAVPLPPESRISKASGIMARRRWSIPLDAPLLLYVGRVAPEKNVMLVVEAFAAIAERFPNAHLLAVGGGPPVNYIEICRKQAEQVKGGERIHFVGAVPHDELDPIYATADLFVFSSSTETQGLVVAEARACGTPCVVVKGGGASETVTQDADGIVVDEDVSAFVNAIEAVMGNGDRLAEMSQACLRTALEYSPGGMAVKVLNAYEMAIDARQRMKPLDDDLEPDEDDGVRNELGEDNIVLPK